MAFLATWAHCWLLFSRLAINTTRSLSDRGERWRADKLWLLLPSTSHLLAAVVKDHARGYRYRTEGNKYEGLKLGQVGL